MKRETNLRVLYVEDDEDSCELVETILGFANIDVATVQSVENALKRATSESFNLYLLDGKVQDVLTLGLCVKLHELSPDTPIVFYSGYGGKNDISSGLGAGAREYLVKPYFGDLADTIIRIVDNVSPNARAKLLAFQEANQPLPTPLAAMAPLRTSCPTTF
ncbi:MAG: response regulator [bacterium]|nr:response regulator [bacterium]